MATETTFTATADTYLRDDFPGHAARDNNYGAHTSIIIGKDAGAEAFRGLLRFNISTIANALSITAATLRLHISSNPTGGSDASSVYRLLETRWTEGTGTGAVPTTDGASWNNYKALTAWEGGAGAMSDIDAGSRVAFTGPALLTGLTDHDITGLGSICQTAVATESGYVNLLIRTDSEATNAHFWQFYYRLQAGNTKPRLIVTTEPVGLGRTDMTWIRRKYPGWGTLRRGRY